MRQSPLFSSIQTSEAYRDTTNSATYKGICLKTFFLLAITAVVAAITGFYLPTIITSGNFNAFYIALIISSIVGFISVMIGRMNDNAAKYASLIYSICEGLFVGCITAICNELVNGACGIAVFSTLVIFLVMLTLFATGVLRVTNTFRKICMAIGIGSIALLLVLLISSMFIADIKTYLGLCIGMEVFLLVYGVITLTFNFAEAQAVVESGCSKNAEWSVALGLLVSVVYIYVEVLRLISYIALNKD